MDNWPYEYFERSEVECECGCGGIPTRNLLVSLELLRLKYNKPIIITSGFRCKEHNAKVGGGKNSAHVLGLAVDVKVSGADAYYLVRDAIAMGFTGIGVKQKGESRFIHLDISQESFNRPMIWSY
jgi:uncharacterized protein YcbK (DUF882 family)